MDFEEFIPPGALKVVAHKLSAALLGGAWTRRALAKRLEQALGYATLPEQKLLLDDLLEWGETRYPPPQNMLTRYLMESPSFIAAARSRLYRPHEMAITLRPPPFAPHPALAQCNLAKLNTTGALADWLGLSSKQFDWFADARRLQHKTSNPRLQHYRHAFAAKASGPPRLIEAPKARLKDVQRRILQGLLDYVPAHPSAHGFVKGRSCRTSAQIHAGEDILATIDLSEFFPSISAGRVHALFRTLGFPWSVARALTSLCCTATPHKVFERLTEDQRPSSRVQALYEAPHLAQGAPTSPALANLAAWRLDVRLRGLAWAYDANYTRYADDLAFSGGERLSKRIDSFLDVATIIIEDEGYALNARKTRIKRQSTRQQVTGIVVNDRINIERGAFDALKATLHNCVKYGPESQNRAEHPDFRAHLEGRVGWVASLNPEKGARLRLLFDKIQWSTRNE